MGFLCSWVAPRGNQEAAKATTTGGERKETRRKLSREAV